jgi:hypothetical protein
VGGSAREALSRPIERRHYARIEMNCKEFRDTKSAGF